MLVPEKHKGDKMEYKDFCEKVRKAVSEYMSDSTEVTLTEIAKNNGLKLMGLLIRNPESKVSPTIYLENFYEKYENGETFASIIREIISVFEKHSNECIDVDYYDNYSVVSENIIYKLVSYEMNRELLEGVPYVKWRDLAIVFCHLVPTSYGIWGSILIQNEHISVWNVTVDDLYECASYNTPRLCPDELINIGDMIGCDITVDMYVLTNKNRMYGANTLLYSNHIRSIAEKFKCGIYIIPSSIHELILLPESLQSNSVYIRQMIHDVNRHEVSRDEILSDSLYYYNYEKNMIELIEDSTVEVA